MLWPCQVGYVVFLHPCGARIQRPLTKERPFVFNGRMSKGERTRATILDEAVALTSTNGVTGLTIGSLAERLGMSKSGLFAHFGSKEQLQQAVLERASELFAETVVKPAFAQPRGLPRLRALFENWIDWAKDPPMPGGCPLQAASFELDDQPGPLRDYLAHTQEQLRSVVAGAVRRAVDEGHIRADTDPDQFAFEGLAIGYAFAMQHRLLRHPEAERWARTAMDALFKRAVPPAS